MESARSSEQVASAPSAADVEEQLERILASESVHLPERARRFLRFVVSETLAGRSQYLKAYTIADIVFGRQNFDAQSDPAVRIEAGRIRRELERYYLMAGPGEPLIITIPKGGYVPTFERSACFANSDDRRWKLTLAHGLDGLSQSPDGSGNIAAGIVVRNWLIAGGLAGAVLLGIAAFLLFEPEKMRPGEDERRPSIAVVSFDFPTDDKDLLRISRGTTDEIIAKLVRFKEVTVIDARSGGDGNDEKSSSARYMLHGTLRKDANRIRSSVRLVRRSDGAVVWASNYDTDLSVQTAFEAEIAVADEIAAAVAQPFGVMFESDQVEGLEAYDCTLSYYNYRRVMTQAALTTAQKCLASQTAKAPRDATSLAFLSLTYLDQMRFSYKLGTIPSKDHLETATKLAERASGIDPRNARALQAVMLTSFFRNDIEGALEAGAQSYQLNPNDSDVAGEYGLRLSMSGHWATGCDLISKAVSQHAGPPGYYEVGMALCAFMRGDLKAAELWSRMSDLAYNPMHRMVLMSILGASGKTDQAREELNWLNANAPALMRNIRQEVRMRLTRPEDQNKVLSGLRAGGAIINETTESQ